MTPLVRLLDPLSRAWWRAVGRPVDLDGEHTWLDAPMSEGSRVEESWLAVYADRLGAEVREPTEAGLVASLGELDGPGFAAAALDPAVRDFYERTTAWRMEVWTGWSPWAWPGGEAISRLFSKRVGQLALPMRPLDVARGMDSRITLVVGRDGRQLGAGWLRALRGTGETVYSGCYGIRTLPGADRPSVHVAFPLDHGNVQVFLRPEVGDDGSLWLRSPPGGFGADGAYVVVRHGGRTYAARVPLHEAFHVYADRTDADRVLRTDHDLRLWSAPAVRLHYRLEPRRTA